ncbi:MAG: hypothetical protein R3B06_19885 [Kofleriaceae bacterium]
MRAGDQADELGRRLRRLVTPRTATTCLSVSTVTAVPLVTAPAPSPCPPAAAPIWLWCAGRPVPTAALDRALGVDGLALATALELVRVDGALARPTVRLAPVGGGLVVCDLAGAAAADRVPWPDDSTLHLAGCLPAGRLGRWLDVGTGPAALPLAIGPRADRRRATDVSPHALALARRGLALAGADDVELEVADLLAGAGAGWALVTFNAPIPAEHPGGGAAGTWHRAAPGAEVLPRFWRAVAEVVGPGGEVLVHGAVAADGSLGPPRRGAVTVARYTPLDQPGFAVTRWRPDHPAGWRAGDVVLTAARPYLTRADLDAIEADGEPAPAGDMG